MSSIAFSRTRTAAAVAAAVFFLLSGYEFVRSTSNSLFQQAYGTANLPLVMALIPVATGLLVLGFHLLLRRFGPRRSLLISTVFSGAAILGCSWGIHAGVDLCRAGLLLFREAYIVLLLEQCWSFVNSTFDEDFAKRFNGPFTAVGSIGGIAGGLLVGALSERLGTHAMPVFAAALLIPAAYFGDLAYRSRGEYQRVASAGSDESLAAPPVPGEKRLLWTLFFLVASTQVISTVLGLSFQGHLQLEVPQVDAQTALSGNFYAALNGVSLVLQVAVAPILLRRVPLRIVHLGIPAVHVATALLLILSPSLFTAGIAFLTFKALDYSIFRVSKEILYIPLSFAGRYRAKQDIDVFGYRLSKGGASAAIAAIQKTGISAAALFPAIALGAAATWAALLFRVFNKAAAESPESRKAALPG